MRGPRRKPQSPNFFRGTIIGFLQSGPADERDTRGDGRADGWAGPENVCISVQKPLNNVNSSGSLKL